MKAMKAKWDKDWGVFDLRLTITTLSMEQYGYLCGLGDDDAQAWIEETLREALDEAIHEKRIATALTDAEKTELQHRRIMTECGL